MQEYYCKRKDSLMSLTEYMNCHTCGHDKCELSQRLRNEYKHKLRSKKLERILNETIL